MSYFLNVTDGEGVLLGRVQLDGLKLDWSVDQRLVGELVADEMGGDAVKACSQLAIPTPQEA